MSTCYPTESKQIPQVNFTPERGSQQGEEPGKRMAPAAHDAKKNALGRRATAPSRPASGGIRAVA